MNIVQEKAAANQMSSRASLKIGLVFSFWANLAPIKPGSLDD
jgi:hypothetical protein